MQSITDGLWTDADLIQQPAGVRLPVRMNVARLDDGSLWVHSPLEPTEARVAAVQALGEVRHLVAPSLMHHLYIGGWSERFPDAEVHGVPGLAAKRTDVAFDHELGEPHPAWAGTIDQTMVGGAPGLNEFAFYYRPAKALLCTDLVFNIVEPPNLATSMVLVLAGTRGRFARSRAWWSFTKDKQARNTSIQTIAGWDIDVISMGHGDPITEGGGDLFRAAWADSL